MFSKFRNILQDAFEIVVSFAIVHQQEEIPISLTPGLSNASSFNFLFSMIFVEQFWFAWRFKLKLNI